MTQLDRIEAMLRALCEAQGLIEGEDGEWGPQVDTVVPDWLLPRPLAIPSGQGEELRFRRFESISGGE